MEAQIYYLIYQTKHIDSGKIYIGKHVTKNPDDPYLGSGKHIRRAIKKYGRQAFEKTILFYCDSEEDLNLKEKEIVTEEFLQTVNTYNMRTGGDGGYIGKEFYNSIRGIPKNPESIQKGAEKRKGQKRSLDSKEKMSKAHQVDIDKNAIRMASIGFKRYIKGVPNLVCADSLEYDFMGMKFDVVIGNPPYQKPAIKQGVTGNGGSLLWPQFVEKAFKLCKTNGVISYIHPPIWRKPNHKLFDLLKAKDIVYLRILSLKEGQKLFGVSTAVDWYILKNRDYRGETQVSASSKTFSVNLKEKSFLSAASPDNPLYQCFGNTISQKILFSETDFFTKKGVRNYQEKYIEGFYSIKDAIVQKIYFEPNPANIEKALKHRVPKVIIQLTGHKLHVYNDFDANYVLPQFCCAIPIYSKDDGNAIVNWFNSNSINFEDFSWGMTRPWRVFQYLKPDFWKIAN